MRIYKGIYFSPSAYLYLQEVLRQYQGGCSFFLKIIVITNSEHFSLGEYASVTKDNVVVSVISANPIKFILKNWAFYKILKFTWSGLIVLDKKLANRSGLVSSKLVVIQSIPRIEFPVLELVDKSELSRTKAYGFFENLLKTAPNFKPPSGSKN